MPAPATARRPALTSLALVLTAIAGTACSGPSSAGHDDGAPAPARGDDAGAQTPKAPVVTGTPDTSDLNETLGVFVAPNGQP